MPQGFRFLAIAAAILAGSSMGALAQTAGGAAAPPAIGTGAGAVAGSHGITGLGRTPGLGTAPGIGTGSNVGTIPDTTGTAGYSAAYPGWAPGSSAEPGLGLSGANAGYGGGVPMGSLGPGYGGYGSVGVGRSTGSTITTPSADNAFSTFPSTTVGAGGKIIRPGRNTTGGANTGAAPGLGGATNGLGGMTPIR